MAPTAAPLRAIPLQPRPLEGRPLRAESRRRRDRTPALQRLVRGFVRILRKHPHTAAVLTVALVTGVLLRATDSTATAGPRSQVASPAMVEATGDATGLASAQAASPASMPAASLAIAGPMVASPAPHRLAGAPADVVGGLVAGPLQGTRGAQAPVLGGLASVQLHGAAANPFLVPAAGVAGPDARDAATEDEIVARTFNALLGEPDLKSASVLIMDPHTGRPLYAKNDRDVLPIASITKLMTALVVLESGAPMGEVIEITKDDLDRLKSSSSRLRIGASFTRETLLRLALMASENRAASALARAHPGGKPAFVAAMNRKAAALGMHDTHFGDPTGLDKTNVSTANDLVRLVQADWHNPTIRAYSTSGSLDVTVGRQVLRFNNTNPLLRSEHAGWQIDLSKTGFIEEAGHCLVMRATVAERDVVIVLLNSQGKLTRIGDANRIRRWIEAQPDYLGARVGQRLG